MDVQFRKYRKSGKVITYFSSCTAPLAVKAPVNDLFAAAYAGLLDLCMI
jgi:hypothetical protein